MIVYSKNLTTSDVATAVLCLDIGQSRIDSNYLYLMDPRAGARVSLPLHGADDVGSTMMELRKDSYILFPSYVKVSFR